MFLSSYQSGSPTTHIHTHTQKRTHTTSLILSDQCGVKLSRIEDKKEWHVKRRRESWGRGGLRSVSLIKTLLKCQSLLFKYPAGSRHLHPFQYKIYCPFMVNYIISQQKLYQVSQGGRGEPSIINTSHITTESHSCCVASHSEHPH